MGTYEFGRLIDRAMIDSGMSQVEAHHWRQRSDVRAMVRYLWNPDDLRRDIAEGNVAGNPDADA